VAPLRKELAAASANIHRGENTTEDFDKRVVFFVAEQWLVTVRDDNVDFFGLVLRAGPQRNPHWLARAVGARGVAARLTFRGFF